MEDATVAAVEHGVPLVLPKWVHPMWAQDEDGQDQDSSQAGGFTVRTRKAYVDKGLRSWGPAGSPNQARRPGRTREPEFPAGGQAPSRVLPHVPVDKLSTSPRKTWEARRRQRGREARPVVVSAPVHPKADAPT